MVLWRLQKFSMIHVNVVLVCEFLTAVVWFGESLREFPCELFDAARGARFALHTFILHPNVPHVPHEPPGQAGEQQQRAGVNEEIPVKHAVLLHVPEHADEQQDHTDDVEDDRHDEYRQTGADAPQLLHHQEQEQDDAVAPVGIAEDLPSSGETHLAHEGNALVTSLWRQDIAVKWPSYIACLIQRYYYLCSKKSRLHLHFDLFIDYMLFRVNDSLLLSKTE